MRYRKRIKIAKGLYINLSASGASLSVGPKGAAMTFGKRGTYLNTGLPGTGLYNRQRIGGAPNKTRSRNTNANSNSDSIPDDPETKIIIEINVDEKGHPTLKATDNSGNEITDEAILQRIKHGEQYRQNVEILMNKRKDQIENNIKSFIEIYKSTPELTSENKLKKQLEKLKTTKYIREKFPEKKPQKKDAQRYAGLLAIKNVNNILFWRNKKLREKYVLKNTPKLLKERTDKWESGKAEFEKGEDIKEKGKNAELLNDYNSLKTNIDNYINGDEDFISKEIEAILKSITLAVEFSVDYEYNKENSTLYVDIDLPEIEDMPKLKVKTLVSGKISIKDKNQKELKQEYATCVCGISFYFAGLFFNITSNIKTIQISGYTQRINKKTGNLDDQYVYSIKFTRDIFQTLNYKQIDPIEAFANFDNIMSITKTYALKTIVPFGKIA